MNSQSWAATLVVVLIAFGGGFIAGRQGPSPADARAARPAVSAACHFSPKGGCTDALVAEIEHARQVVELQGYSFTSRPIGSALVAAHRRGVRVTVLLDAVATGEHRGEADYVVRNGVPVFLDSRHALAHNKVLLVDGRTTVTGSFNFTRAAEEDNAENILILHDQPGVQDAYEENFRTHLAHAQKYSGR